MPAALRVLITDRPWPDTDIERDTLHPIGAEIVEPATSAADELADLAPSVDAIGVCWAPLPAELVERCPRCRVIARFGVGLDNIPVATATRLGIPVTYLPDYCVGEVADHTVALILALVRGVPLFDRALKGGEYDPNRFVPTRLSEMAVGLIGFGRIGKAVADRLAAFGFNVLVTSRSNVIKNRSVQVVSLDELLEAADIVSLHAPLTTETHKLMDRQRLSRMKPGSFLVNTSRGGLVDPIALRNALESGHLAGAALDVFDPEPPAAANPLVNHPRAIVTPHVAFRSAEAVVELRTRVARQIATVLTGGVPEHVVNPEVLKASI